MWKAILHYSPCLELTITFLDNASWLLDKNETLKIVRKIEKTLTEKEILRDKTFSVIFILKTCFCLVWNILQSNIK